MQVCAQFAKQHQINFYINLLGIKFVLETNDSTNYFVNVDNTRIALKKMHALGTKNAHALELWYSRKKLLAWTTMW